jgi:hypothetical protein
MGALPISVELVEPIGSPPDPAIESLPEPPPALVMGLPMPPEPEPEEPTEPIEPTPLQHKMGKAVRGR